MAESDFTFLNDGLDIATVDRGVTTGIARPPGGENFVFGFNSLSTAEGAVGLFTNQVNFAPMSEGGSVRGVLQRGVSGGTTNFAPFLFIGLGGPSVNDQGYLLGLADGDPHHIVLRKGAIVQGLPDVTPGTQGVLLRSTGTFSPATYVHLRLDMIVNLSGDVILQVFENDLSANPIGTAPDFQPVTGMPDFVDDSLGINSGSPAFTSGRAGFAFFTKDVTRRAFLDQVEVFRQI